MDTQKNRAHTTHCAIGLNASDIFTDSAPNHCTTLIIE